MPIRFREDGTFYFENEGTGERIELSPLNPLSAQMPMPLHHPQPPLPGLEEEAVEEEDEEEPEPEPEPELYVCECCGDSFESVATYSNADGDSVGWCDGCYEDSSGCQYRNCRNRIPTGYEEYTEGGAGPYCNVHIGEMQNAEDEDREEDEEDYEPPPVCNGRSPMIREYSYKISPEPFMGSCSLYMIGIELEMEVKGTHNLDLVARKVLDLVNETKDPHGDYAVLKSDGSLNRGFEMVTRPAEIGEHKKRLDKFFKNIPDGLLSYESPRCGLHIHVNRGCEGSRMSILHAGKMRSFVASTETQDYITFICGRPKNNYCERYETIQPSPRKRGQLESPGEKFMRQVNINGKYTAWNCTEFTMEFRAPKGTLVEPDFWARVEFAVAQTSYCSMSSVKRATSLEYFVKWLKSCPPSYYPNLMFKTYQFLKEEPPKKKNKEPPKKVEMPLFS